MTTNEEEKIDSTNNPETTDNPQSDSEQSDEQKIDVEALKKENETLKAQKEHWREKAEKGNKKPEPNPEGISTNDMYDLLQSNVHKDDVPDVVKASKMLGVSIHEALETSFVKTLLSDKGQKRKAAEAAHTNSNRSSSPKRTDAQLLQDAASGKMPESDEDIQKLWRLRKGLK